MKTIVRPCFFAFFLAPASAPASSGGSCLHPAPDQRRRFDRLVDHWDLALIQLEVDNFPRLTFAISTGFGSLSPERSGTGKLEKGLDVTIVRRSDGF
jgi:hypothetical protein